MNLTELAQRPQLTAEQPILPGLEPAMQESPRPHDWVPVPNRKMWICRHCSTTVFRIYYGVCPVPETR